MKRKYLKGLKFLTGALLYFMFVTGCGGDSYSASKESATESYAAEEAAYEDGGIYEADYEAYEGSSNSSGTQAEEVTEGQSAAKQKRKLITNMSMSTETKEFDKTIDFLQKRTDELGGYVESFSTDKSSYSDERKANLTLRIPEEKLSGFVSEVAEKSNITSQDMNVTDVTLTYADLESHRNALRAEEDQLLTLMERAETIEDIMTIQDKLTDVRYQLESMESQLRTYDNQITFSTLKVSVREVIEYTPEPVKNPTYLERARDGFFENCSAVATFFKELSLLIITHLPVLLILLVIVIIIISIIRFADKKHKEKMAKRQPVAPGPVPGGMPPVHPNSMPPVTPPRGPISTALHQERESNNQNGPKDESEKKDESKKD